MDGCYKTNKGKLNKLTIGYRNKELVTITECIFANELVIYARSQKVWNKALEERNLKINIEKGNGNRKRGMHHRY